MWVEFEREAKLTTSIRATESLTVDTGTCAYGAARDCVDGDNGRVEGSQSSQGGGVVASVQAEETARAPSPPYPGRVTPNSMTATQFVFFLNARERKKKVLLYAVARAHGAISGCGAVHLPSPSPPIAAAANATGR